jgi:anaerobic magnesium-protoporphyrin IX monomethyl ester cyclase
VLWLPDRAIRAAQRWYYRMGRRVWFYEIWKFIVADKLTASGPRLSAFWDRQVDGEESMRRERQAKKLSLPVYESSCGSACSSASSPLESVA